MHLIFTSQWILNKLQSSCCDAKLFDFQFCFLLLPLVTPAYIRLNSFELFAAPQCDVRSTFFAHDRVLRYYLALIDVLSLFIFYAGCTERLRGTGKEEIVTENRPILPQMDSIRNATAATTTTVKISTVINFSLTRNPKVLF